MALKLKTDIKGFEHEFYIKVLDTKSENKGNVLARYGYFANIELAENTQNAIATEIITFVATSDADIFKQTYIQLKKTDIFKDAIDC